MITPINNVQQQPKISYKANLHPIDLRYKEALIEGIQKRYQFSPKIESLESVVAPMELKELLGRLKPQHFNTEIDPKGPRTFDNVKAGGFRANLHVHTNHSDGEMNTSEYLDQSKLYADKVAKLKDDNLPAYISATTDHNNVLASQEIIAMIADDPKRYKNFKFVSGCEFLFGSTNPELVSPSFEAVGLGINPFSTKILTELNEYNTVDLVNRVRAEEGIVSYAHPLRHCQLNGQEPKFINYLKEIGVNGIESNYQYGGFSRTPDMQEKMERTREIAKENNWFETGGTDTHAKNIFHKDASNILDELF